MHDYSKSDNSISDNSSSLKEIKGPQFKKSYIDKKKLKCVCKDI